MSLFVRFPAERGCWAPGWGHDFHHYHPFYISLHFTSLLYINTFLYNSWFPLSPFSKQLWAIQTFRIIKIQKGVKSTNWQYIFGKQLQKQKSRVLTFRNAKVLQINKCQFKWGLNFQRSWYWIWFYNPLMVIIKDLFIFRRMSKVWWTWTSGSDTKSSTYPE